MNLFGFFGISHSVIMDLDNDKDVHEEINKFIKQNKNDFTHEVLCFQENFEKYLDINSAVRNDKKPLNCLYHYKYGKIKTDKIDLLKRDYIDKLIP